ncbi:MAG: hypothetical protein LJE68_05420, partial [Rhodobacter sp.]|nr:hypothetical protein [Rhodobacter sp.]
MTILIFVSRHFKLAAFLVGIGAFVQHYAGSGFGVDAFLKDRLWMITQYLVNYVDHGFARRALLGTVLRPFIQASGDPEVAAVVALLIVFALCFAICVFAIDWLLPHHETRTADLSHGLRVAFVIGSAGIMQMIRDHGRYDLSNFCLLFLAIYLALNRRLFWTGLVAAVGVLHHEAFAVFALPLVFALVAHVSAQNGESRFNRAVLLFLTPVLAAIIAVAVFGNSELAADIDLGEG